MTQPFAARATLLDFRLMGTKSELLKFNPRTPLTLACDKADTTYWSNDKLLTFTVTYALRATDGAIIFASSEDVWQLSCEYGILYTFEGAPPTQSDANAMARGVLTLAHNYLREWVDYVTRFCCLPPLVLDLAKFPQAA